MATLSSDEAHRRTVRDFVDREVRRVAGSWEHRTSTRRSSSEQMKRMGIFGLAIPEPWGDAPVSMPATRCHHRTGAGLDEPGRRDGRAQWCPSWLLTFAHRSRRTATLPKMATGEIRATMALTSPVAAPTCRR